MSNEKHRTQRFLKSWVINIVALMLASMIVHGLRFSDKHPYASPIVTAFVLSVLNELIRPFLIVLALPLLILTLGLFTLVINGLVLALVSWLLKEWGLDYFVVDNFWSAFLGAIIISITSTILAILTGGSRIHVRRPPPSPPDRRGGDGNGPIIDV